MNKINSNLVLVIVVVATMLNYFNPFGGIGYHHELQKDILFMKTINLTQGKSAIVDDEDYEYLMQWKWCAHKRKHTYYAVRSTKGRTIQMHREILKSKCGHVDHINKDGLNNQKSNLRIASKSQNAINVAKYVRKNKESSSSYKGVYQHKKHKLWIARINKSGAYYYLGSYHNEIDAALAYNKAAIELHGEFAHLNTVT